jgi:hypothetical protein
LKALCNIDTLREVHWLNLYKWRKVKSYYQHTWGWPFIFGTGPASPLPCVVSRSAGNRTAARTRCSALAPLWLPRVPQCCFGLCFPSRWAFMWHKVCTYLFWVRHFLIFDRRITRKLTVCYSKAHVAQHWHVRWPTCRRSTASFNWARKCRCHLYTLCNMGVYALTWWISFNGPAQHCQ